MSEPSPGVSWERIKTLFAQALEQPESSRDAWLIERCAGDADLLAELRSLLHAHSDSAAFLTRGGAELLAPTLDHADTGESSSTRWLGSQFGVWQIHSLLGEGGMGSVFAAERSDGQFRQRVALKLIRGEFDTPAMRERFLRERQILARLQHPNIAQLHDGGVTPDGIPYFTMEFVHGEPITRYSDRNTLDIDARLRLLLDVAAAVQFAHRNLIVHRDLKPSNIFVAADGQVKLLDFGIAKLLADDEGATETATQARLMTREYAAPEQVLAQPITTATDVYSLGVLMYELLSGRLPYLRADSGEFSWPKAIVDEAPQPLSRAVTRVSRDPLRDGDAQARARSSALQALQKRLRGDLDRIVSRALEKAPEARYVSAAAMAADIEAYLQGRALPGGSWRYRMVKFVRRNRASVAIAAGLGALALAGIAGTLIEARNTEREARKLLRETQTTAAVKDFLLELFAAGDPREGKTKDLSMQGLLDRGAQRIDSKLDAQPALKAELQSVLGGIYSRLGLYAQAAELQRKAVDGLDASGEKAELAAKTLRELAETTRAKGDIDQATILFDQAIDRMRVKPEVQFDELGRALYMRAFMEIGKHRYAQALTYADEEERIARQHPDKPMLLGDALHAMGSVHWGLKQLKQAEAELVEATQLHAKGPKASMSLASDRQTLAMVYETTDRYVDALRVNEQALASAVELLGDKHPFVATLQVFVAQDHEYLGNYPQARLLLEHAAANQRELLGTDHPKLAAALNALGDVLIAQGDPAQAEKEYAEAAEIWKRKFGADYSYTVTSRAELAFAHLLQNQLDQADGELQQVIADGQRTNNDAERLWRARLGEVQRRRGNSVAAIALQEVALADAREKGSSRHVAWIRYYLGLSLADHGDVARAREVLEQSLAHFVAVNPQSLHPMAASIRAVIAKLPPTQ